MKNHINAILFTRRFSIAIGNIFLIFAAVSLAGAQDATFNIGDCVEYDTADVSRPATRWRKARIISSDGFLFTVKLEPRAAGEPDSTRVSVKDAKNSIRQANGCSQSTEIVRPNETRGDSVNTATADKTSGECAFNKDYKKVSNTAPASAALFKGVIFEWEAEVNKRFQDFGMTFLSFQMGKTFRNRVYAGINVRKDVDPAPVGAAIYPIKTKYVICQKDLSFTIRWVWEVEYSCFKDKFGAWNCLNKAPKQLEHTAIPHD